MQSGRACVNSHGNRAKVYRMLHKMGQSAPKYKKMQVTDQNEAEWSNPSKVGQNEAKQYQAMRNQTSETKPAKPDTTTQRTTQYKIRNRTQIPPKTIRTPSKICKAGKGVSKAVSNRTKRSDRTQNERHKTKWYRMTDTKKSLSKRSKTVQNSAKQNKRNQT